MPFVVVAAIDLSPASAAVVAAAMGAAAARAPAAIPVVHVIAPPLDLDRDAEVVARERTRALRALVDAAVARASHPARARADPLAHDDGGPRVRGRRAGLRARRGSRRRRDDGPPRDQPSAARLRRREGRAARRLPRPRRASEGARRLAAPVRGRADLHRVRRHARDLGRPRDLVRTPRRPAASARATRRRRRRDRALGLHAVVEWTALEERPRSPNGGRRTGDPENLTKTTAAELSRLPHRSGRGGGCGGPRAPCRRRRRDRSSSARRRASRHGRRRGRTRRRRRAACSRRRRRREEGAFGRVVRGGSRMSARIVAPALSRSWRSRADATPTRRPAASTTATWCVLASRIAAAATSGESVSRTLTTGVDMRSRTRRVTFHDRRRCTCRSRVVAREPARPSRAPHPPSTQGVRDARGPCGATAATARTGLDSRAARAVLG